MPSHDHPETQELHNLALHRKLQQSNAFEAGTPDIQHLLHLKLHWSLLSHASEDVLFYCLAIPSWAFEIAAAITGSFDDTTSYPFIACVTVFLVLHWAAWLMTVFGMLQRASWRREESVEERVQFLWFAIRLQRLMLPTAVIALATFIPAYVRRDHLDDLAYWLLFLLFFIINTVCSVMNAYNNITWEADRLWFEDRIPGVPSAHYAIFGI